MRYAFRELKLVVEPGGAIGLAALLAGKLDVKGKVVVGDPVRRQCRRGFVCPIDFVVVILGHGEIAAITVAGVPHRLRI